MIPLSSAISAGLTFSKVSRSRIYELRLNNDVVGTLLRPSFWSMSYRAETQAGIWTFRRAGWLGGKSEVLDRSSQQQIATFKMAWGGRGGRLTFAMTKHFNWSAKAGGVRSGAYLRKAASRCCACTGARKKWNYNLRRLYPPSAWRC